MEPVRHRKEKMTPSGKRPDRADERARIEVAGGLVTRLSRMRDDGVKEPYGPWRLIAARGSPTSFALAR